MIVPGLGASAFALYFAEGMGGAADGFAGADRDGKVTFAELAVFVARRVARLTRKTTEARQTPRAYGPDGADFVMVYKGSRPGTRSHPPPPSHTRPSF